MGEYGATAAPVNQALQARVLDGDEAITCRPADNIKPELTTLENELDEIAAQKSIVLANDKIDDVLTYALFPQIGLKFLENRNNPDAFEPAPSKENADAIAQVSSTAPQSNAAAGAQVAYDVVVDGKQYHVEVAPSGQLTSVTPSVSSEATNSEPSNAQTINAPLAGNVFKVLVRAGDAVTEGDVVMIIEAMKMETEIRSAFSGTVRDVFVGEGDAIASAQPLITLG